MTGSIPISIPTFNFSVESYHKLIDAGVFKPTDKVELIEGKIIPRSSVNSPHAACVRRLGNILRGKCLTQRRSTTEKRRCLYLPNMVFQKRG